jgi:hypothetical protein
MGFEQEFTAFLAYGGCVSLFLFLLTGLIGQAYSLYKKYHFYKKAYRHYTKMAKTQLRRAV